MHKHRIIAVVLGLAACCPSQARVLLTDDWAQLQAAAGQPQLGDPVARATDVMADRQIDPVLREFRLHGLARQIGQQGDTRGGRTALNAMLDEPVVARVALHDAGRSVHVPAFPVAAAARAALRMWDQAAVRDAVGAAIRRGDRQALQALIRREPRVVSDAVAAALRADAAHVNVVAGLSGLAQNAQLEVGLATGDFDPWLRALRSGQARHAAIEAAVHHLVAVGDVPTSHAVLQQAVASGVAASAAIQGLAQLAPAHPPALDTLDTLLADPELGVDAGLVLGRLGPTALARLRAALRDGPESVRVPALIGLRAAADLPTLQAFARDPGQPQSMREQVRSWLR